MGIKFSDYGQERERIATESEIAIFDVLQELAGQNNLRLIRKSNNYVSAIFHGWDLARFKYTPRAKWIQFPLIDVGSTKRRINAPEDARAFRNEIDSSIAHIKEFSNK